MLCRAGSPMYWWWRLQEIVVPILLFKSQQLPVANASPFESRACMYEVA
jgi:hypothetical protein